MNDRHRGYTEKELDDLLEKRDRSLVRGYEMKLADKDADLARLREENAALRIRVEQFDDERSARIVQSDRLRNKVAHLSALVEEAAEIIEHYYHPAMQKSDISIAMQDWLRRARGGK